MAAVIQNPPKALGDQFYREAIEHCRSYNAQLCAERIVRLPFLDSQTGVAQNNCCIWMERHHRGPGLAAGQMYTYPARCWKKKRRLHTSMDSSLKFCGLHISKETLPAPSTSLEALLRGDKRNSEKSHLEIQVRGSGRRRADLDDQDKPCLYESRFKQKLNSKAEASVCGKHYRNRTGISYHYGHSHTGEKEEPQTRKSEIPQSPLINQHPHSHKRGRDEEKEEKVFAGAEDLFGTTSESDSSTFHGFEEDELEEHSPNSNKVSPKCR